MYSSKRQTNRNTGAVARWDGQIGAIRIGPRPLPLLLFRATDVIPADLTLLRVGVPVAFERTGNDRVMGVEVLPRKE